MSLAAALLTPFALMLPATGAETCRQGPDESVSMSEEAQWPDPHKAGQDQLDLQTFQHWPFLFVGQSFEPPSAQQVRIERRVTIRITPQATPMRHELFMGVPEREIGPQFVERKIGKCLPVSRISGVQAESGSRLILYLSDRRMVSADLERACRARDFYSGFYLSGNKDGNLCVDRDILQSRSGANCKLTRIRQLIEAGD